MKRFKKAAALILAAVFVLGASVLTFAADGYVFTYNNVDYTPGMDAKTAMDSIGTAVSSRDVNNCANGYINKAYMYGNNDVELYIEQQNGTGSPEIVANITLMGSNVKTQEGLKPGDDESRVSAVYPSAKKGLGTYTVTKGNTELYIKIKDGKVSYISYLTVN